MSEIITKIEAVLRQVKNRTEHDSMCATDSQHADGTAYGPCDCTWGARVLQDQARTVERMIAEVRTEDPADSLRKRNEALVAAALRATQETK